MKIICQIPCVDAPVATFSLPETALGRAGQPLFLPDEVGRICALPAVVVRVGRLGKHIAERFAHRYYDSWSMGLLFVIEKRLKQLQQNGQPWHEAFDMDGVLRVGRDIPMGTVDTQLRFTITENPKVCFDITALHLRKTFDALLHHTTEYSTIRQGDLLVSCLTSNPLPVTMESTCHGHINEEELLQVKLK